MPNKQRTNPLYPHPFSKAYWRDAAAELRDTHMLVFAALMIALRLVMKQVSIPITPVLRINTAFFVNALGAMRMVHAFLPLMQTGMKRLCFVSSEAGAVSVAHREDLSSYCMSKTALNMVLRLMFNQLQPMGYSFRLFHPGWVRSPKIEHSTDAIPTFRDQEGNLTGKFWPWETAAAAVPQFIEDGEFEDRLVLIDNEGAAWPF